MQIRRGMLAIIGGQALFSARNQCAALCFGGFKSFGSCHREKSRFACYHQGTDISFSQIHAEQTSLPDRNRFFVMSVYILDLFSHVRVCHIHTLSWCRTDCLYQSSARSLSHKKMATSVFVQRPTASSYHIRMSTYYILTMSSYHVLTEIFVNVQVEPLLRVLHTLSHRETTIWICVNERCAVAHKEFLDTATEYFRLDDRQVSVCRSNHCCTSSTPSIRRRRE